jgi:hypothetical protein
MPRIERPELGSGRLCDLFDALQADRARFDRLGMNRAMRWQESRHLGLGDSVVMADGYDWNGWEFCRWEAWGRSSAFAIWPERGSPFGYERASRWSLYAVRNGALALGIFPSQWAAMEAAERWDREEPPQWREPDFFPWPGLFRAKYILVGGEPAILRRPYPQWPASHPVPPRQIPARAA